MLPIIYSITLLVVVGGLSTFVFATQHSKVTRIREENTEFKKRVNEFQMYSKLKLKDLVDKSNDKYAKVATSYDELNQEIDTYKKVNAKYVKEKQDNLRDLSKKTAKESDVVRDMINSQDIYIDRQKKKIIDETYSNIRSSFNGKKNLAEVRSELGFDPKDGKYYATDFELADNNTVSVLGLRRKMNLLKSQITTDLEQKLSRNVNTLRTLDSRQNDMVLQLQNVIDEQNDDIDVDVQLTTKTNAMLNDISLLKDGLIGDATTTFTRVNQHQLQERSNTVEKISNENIGTLQKFREKMLLNSKESAEELASRNAQLSNNLTSFQNEWTTKFQQTQNSFDSQLLSLEGTYEEKKKSIEDAKKAIDDFRRTVNQQYLPTSDFPNALRGSSRVHQHLADRITNQTGEVVYAPNYKMSSGTYTPSSGQTPDHMTDLNDRVNVLDTQLGNVILPYTNQGTYNGNLYVNDEQKIEFTDAIGMQYDDNKGWVDLSGNLNINGHLFVIRGGNPMWVNKSLVENAVNAIDASYATVAQKADAQTLLNTKADKNHHHDNMYFKKTDLQALQDRFDNYISQSRTLDNIQNTSIPPKTIRSLHIDSIDFTGASSTSAEFAHLQGENTLLSSVPNIPASAITWTSGEVNFNNVRIPDSSLRIKNFDTVTSSVIKVPINQIEIPDQSIPHEAIGAYPTIEYSRLPVNLRTGTSKLQFELNESTIGAEKVDWTTTVPSMTVNNIVMPNATVNIGGNNYSLKKIT